MVKNSKRHGVRISHPEKSKRRLNEEKTTKLSSKREVENKETIDFLWRGVLL